jgi:hypothetical protein
VKDEFRPILGVVLYKKTISAGVTLDGAMWLPGRSLKEAATAIPI